MLNLNKNTSIIYLKGYQKFIEYCLNKNLLKSLPTGTNLYIENSTGKSTLQHVADNTIDAELRNCEIDHSAEINQIFFVTLDQFDCVLK